MSGELQAVMEALVMASTEALSVKDAAMAADVSEDEAREALQRLAVSYSERGSGVVIEQLGGGWRVSTRPDLAWAVKRLVVKDATAKLSQAALETLAVIAYKQPVTRSRVSAVRGVNVDGVVRTLEARGLICEVKAEDDGPARLYGTTPYFLEALGLETIGDLPPLAPYLPDRGDIDEIAGELR